MRLLKDDASLMPMVRKAFSEGQEFFQQCDETKRAARAHPDWRATVASVLSFHRRLSVLIFVKVSQCGAGTRPTGDTRLGVAQ